MLTKREEEIYKLILTGLTRGEIGKKLFVSENTIKVHVRNILLKYNVKSTKYLILQQQEIGKRG